MLRGPKSGFTLIELLIFSAIFLIVSIALVSTLISVTRVQVRQSAESEVSQQSLFVLQTLQRYIETSSLVDVPLNVPTTTLKLRMPELTSDPTCIYLFDDVLYFQQVDCVGGTAQALTTDKVKVTNLSFIRRSNTTSTSPAPGHDSVSISFVMTFNTQKPQGAFSQLLSSAIARVSAATFDSNIVPSVSDNLVIGASGSRWRSINDLLYFTTTNVGVSAVSPAYTLDVQGPLRLGATAQPTGANGVMYYDSSLNKFRCYENASWKDCAGALTGGQVNYIPLWTSATTQGTSTIYQSGTSIGIGTTTPATRLHVFGAPGTGATLTVESSAPEIQIIDTSAGEYDWRFQPTASDLLLSRRVDSSDIWTTWLTVLSNNGNVGIGTGSVGSKLTVGGGDIFIFTTGQGLILRDTVDSSCHRVYITNNILTSTPPITCP